MRLTGNLVNAYFICKRKFWLYARQFNPDPEFDLLLLGRLISENTYRKEKREIFLDDVKIDLIKRLNENIIICEVKKTSKGLEAAKMQLAFYLIKLKTRGINAKGEILIPEEKKVISLELDEEIEKVMAKAMDDMKAIAEQDTPPPVVKIPFCKKCAFVEFCYS